MIKHKKILTKKDKSLPKVVPKHELTVTETAFQARLLTRTRSWINEVKPAELRRIPFFYNWDPREDPRALTRRLLERYPDLQEDNEAYIKLDTKKADDYVELFSRSVSE